MIRTKRKINKQRGSRSNGGGCTKKRRGAGNKGGKGKAGMRKQHWTWTVIHDPNHFGKHGFKRPQKMIKKVNAVNLNYLEEHADDLIAKGIASKDLGNIFERFYRVDKSRSKSTGGTGLGLAIVKHIIARHHASLELDSEAGVGTEIRGWF